jgi:hypothetical protein
MRNGSFYPNTLAGKFKVVPTFARRERTVYGSQNATSPSYFRISIISVRTKNKIIIWEHIAITKRIIKPRLCNEYNFKVVNTNTIEEIGTFSTQPPNILIKDLNLVKMAEVRHGEMIV